MSARQNKKQRKGRNNPNTRERTVTTLTEDPNTPYLVPLTSEEPAGTLIMSSPFSVASSSAGNPPSSSAYQPPSNYEAFGYTDFPHQQQFFPQQQPKNSGVQQLAGSNDLERLENLKNMIKANQHSNYRPIPQPAALAAHYLGPIPTSQIPPEQNQFGDSNDGSSQAIPTTGSSPSSPVDHGRRPPRLQSKDWEHSSQGKSAAANGAQPTNNVPFDSSPISALPLTSSSSFSFSIQTNSPVQGYSGRSNHGPNAPAAIDTSNIPGGSKTNSAGLFSAGPKSSEMRMSDTPSTVTEGPGPSPRFDSSTARPAPGNPDPARIPVDRLGHGETGYGGPRGPGSTDKQGSFDSKDDLRTPREGSWSARDGPPPDDRRRDLDRPPVSPRTTLNGSGGGSDTRSNPGDRPPMPRDPLPRDDRFYDRERERERDRDYRDRRDWDRDRRPPYDRYRGPPEVVRRPPPEQRHYEPDYSDRAPPRRYDVKEEPISDSRRLSDLRRLPSPMVEDRPVRPEDDRPPLSARLPPSSDTRPPVEVSRPPPHSDSRAPVPPPRPPTPDNRPVREPSFGDRRDKPALLEERRGAPLPPDVRAPVPSVRPADVPGAVRPADARTRDVPLTPVESASRPPIPLEERISRPSLQDRISEPEHLSQPPPVSRPEPARTTSLEERLSAIPVSADSREQRGRIPDRTDRAPAPPRPVQPVDDRSAPPRLPPPASAQDDRRIDDRPARYTRPISPPPGDRATYPPPHSASAVRDDPRAAKGPPSPRPGARDYRPPRPLSRERSGSVYRPDDRNYIPDDRRSEAMDVDNASRFNDSRPMPYNRPFSPPSAADLARDRARAQYPPPSPTRPPHDAPPYDDDRRYTGRDWPQYQSSYGDRRREWNAADEEYYKTRQWDRNAGPPPPVSASDRDRFDREQTPLSRNNGWETRDERERRDFPPRAPSPSRSYDGPSRPLGSRLTDNFSSPVPGGPPNDRSYPPSRDPPPFSRVRQRSLSPARRPGGPIIDDNRPPAKRSREDVYAPGEYYPPSSAPPPSARDPGPPLRRQSDYPPLSRGSSPPPSSGASSYFDNRGPPPSSATTSGTDRDYPRDYPAQSYDRLRSPGPPRGAPYSRGGYTAPRDTRDDRRYAPPPPSSSMLPPRRP
ncbi:hypothetical protein DXG01_016728 [Tephrocybe rancida]|nr:hypothetical protein DXG01_016728 [Tephrocybe rancida]